MVIEDLIIKLIEELKILNKHQDEICKILQVLARSEIESRLKHIFKNEDEVLVYQLSNGVNPTTEIEKKVSISAMTISRLWQRWEGDLLV